MKYMLLLIAIVNLPAHAAPTDIVSQKSWIHGSENCRSNEDPAIDVLQVDSDTFVLRQNKCINYEAPFIYLMFGEHTLFVQDTGATESSGEFPIYATIKKIAEQWQGNNGVDNLHILVTHSHSHLDHRAGDDQFRNQPNVSLIEANQDAVIDYFGFTQWPNGQAVIDLGNRQLTVMPIPGHQAESLAVYDSRTQWLLTGDTFYPGRLYVREWDEYKSSIQKLVDFADKYPVSALMGTHIEMTSTPMRAYPLGSTFQPDEAVLPLSVDDLRELNSTLKEMGDVADEKVGAKFIISPIGAVQKILGTVLGWFFG